MSKIEKFEDLQVWQNSVKLCTSIYKILSDSRDFSFRDQICRASVSIASNIAEGFERQHNKEFIQFLFIAKGSAGEVRTQLYLGRELGYIENNEYEQLYQTVLLISGQLSKLIKVRKEYFKN